MSTTEPRRPATGSPDSIAQTVPGKNVFHVPFEVLDMMARELPPPSRIAFALSCKPIFTALSSAGAIRGLSRRNLSQQELDEALRLLEKGVPSHFLCFGCMRLCPWRPAGQRHWRGQEHEKCGGTVKRDSFRYRARKGGYPVRPREEGEGFPLRCMFFPLTTHRLAWSPRAEGPEIFFTEVYQVMSRHRLGEPFGLPLEALERRFYCERLLTLDHDEVAADHFSLQKFAHGRRPVTRHIRDRIIEGRAPEPGAGLGLEAGPSSSARLWKFSHEYKAKIIRGELFIRRFHRVTGPRVENSKFVKLLHDLALPVCQHLFTRTKTPEYFRRISTSWVRRDPRVDSHLPAFQSIPVYYFSSFKSFEPRVESCSICSTDYSIQIDFSEQHWNLELTTYHRLGSCVSPDDPMWLNLTSFDTYLPTYSIQRRFRAFPRGCEPGTVQRRWDKGEGRGQWVEAKWASWDRDSVPFHWTDFLWDEDWRGFRGPRVFTTRGSSVR